MEKSRSWSSAHDWKSCNRQKRFEGSNPSFSAMKKALAEGKCFFQQNDRRIGNICCVKIAKRIFVDFSSQNGNYGGVAQLGERCVRNA